MSSEAAIRDKSKSSVYAMSISAESVSLASARNDPGSPQFEPQGHCKKTVNLKGIDADGGDYVVSDMNGWQGRDAQKLVKEFNKCGISFKFNPGGRAQAQPDDPGKASIDYHMENVVHGCVEKSIKNAVGHSLCCEGGGPCPQI